MYLSRVELDTSKKQTQVALVSPNKFHGAIENAFDYAKENRTRNLWRIDKLNGKMYLLLVSKDKPDLTNFARQFGKKLLSYETKEYGRFIDKLSNETVWQFRLIANPTKCVKKEKGRGKRVAHITPEHQTQWLIKQAQKYGFHVDEKRVQVKESKWLMFNKQGKHMVRALAVTYEGKLEITDGDKFRIALVDGIGREKAYGMGLLTIVRTEL